MEKRPTAFVRVALKMNPSQSLRTEKESHRGVAHSNMPIGRPGDLILKILLESLR
jgi:hypothetical protein